ncbi:MAG: hypothetical protein U1D55_06570 [Phycisphaerae bacterium]
MRWICAGAVGCALTAPGKAAPRGGELPAALECVYQSRALIETATVELTRSDVRHFNGEEIRYRVCLAGPDVASENLGDGQGRVLGSFKHAGRPYVVLATPDATYSHDSDDIRMTLSEGTERRHDNPIQLRSLGVVPFLPRKDVGVALGLSSDSAPRPRRFEESRDGDIHVVRELLDEGVITWYIDSARGCSPTRVTFERDGRVVQEARVALRKFDDIWFPEKVEFFVAAYRDGKEPASVVKVLKAEFLKPEQPKRITPADIGIEPGFLALRENAKKGQELEIWDGSRAVTLTDWAWLEMRGVVERGPKNRAALEALPLEPGGAPGAHLPASYATGSTSKPIPLLARAPGLWERYTREFIADHKLDVEQTQRAWRLLSDCQEAAKRHIRSKIDEIEEADRALNALPLEERGNERGAPARERLWKLLEPVDRLFTDRLKPGLERLPTRAQRAALEAASQPTTRNTSP